MEILFLVILVLLMGFALTSGFPVAFSLPGSAILAIALASLAGYLIVGDPSAYFSEGGPIEWLTAGVTNFRSLYWDVERDTLIAVPLFIFMGIMLQRSKIAEDLLVAMAQLFGPVPGGLGISVVFVGALLAATTGIVGATVIAMGLISMPAMMRHKYSNSLAAGTICASGTLGQIIPPSIVLIILADQLGSASDQANTARKAMYKAATGEFSMPASFSVSSASAGDMFMGALIPGLVLVVLYMIYILVTAVVRSKSAPPVPYEGKYDRRFLLNVLLALIPPLGLIFVVLGSILMGVATVNQAGAIGAIGAMVMGGYRLAAGKRSAYTPAILSIVSTIAIFVVLHFFDINIKNIRNSHDLLGVVLAAIAVTGLLVGLLWSGWRAYRIENTLSIVMAETAKTTSMVFIILLGAAMLTAAFRAFGGEIMVREYLTSLPGGFWSQFIVVMAVIFVLGFFIDFIEISVVVVPIVAPILLTDPSANVTAIWLGVMVGMNMQTSFLTPPFGFALFYLRGVAPPSLKTTQIYRGAVAFILLQLTGLAIAGMYPTMVNYLPDRIYLTSDVAPPPINPRLQGCLETLVFNYYDQHRNELATAIKKMQALDLGVVPKKLRKGLEKSFQDAASTFDRVNEVRVAEAAVAEYAPTYRPIHHKVRSQQRQIRKIEQHLDELEKTHTRYTRDGTTPPEQLRQIEQQIKALNDDKQKLVNSLPKQWDQAHQRYQKLAKAEKRARSVYRRTVDGAYATITEFRKLIEQANSLEKLAPQIDGIEAAVAGMPADQAMEQIKGVEKSLYKVAGTSRIKRKFSKARRALKGKKANPAKAVKLLAQGRKLYADEVAWRKVAGRDLRSVFANYDQALQGSIGLRLQKRLAMDQAKEIALCQSVQRDISLNF
ncbi:MAG TPA: TRAP transporter large permease subunit [Gammaproteobacteria bacterium]|nr:TRAP transporter large permease subunit [Gammaproteobacteria bacterium]